MDYVSIGRNIHKQKKTPSCKPQGAALYFQVEISS